MHNGMTNYETWHTALVLENTYKYKRFCDSIRKSKKSLSVKAKNIKQFVKLNLSKDEYKDLSKIDWQNVAKSITER